MYIKNTRNYNHKLSVQINPNTVPKFCKHTAKCLKLVLCQNLWTKWENIKKFTSADKHRGQ